MFSFYNFHPNKKNEHGVFLRAHFYWVLFFLSEADNCRRAQNGDCGRNFKNRSTGVGVFLFRSDRTNRRVFFGFVVFPVVVFFFISNRKRRKAVNFYEKSVCGFFGNKNFDFSEILSGRNKMCYSEFMAFCRGFCRIRNEYFKTFFGEIFRAVYFYFEYLLIVLDIILSIKAKAYSQNLLLI